MTPLPIVWADEAREIFLEYLFFISEKDLGAAERLFEQVERSLEPVSYFPHSGRPGRVPGTREIVSHPNYIAVYEIYDDFILIVDFTHVKKLIPQATIERGGLTERLLRRVRLHAFSCFPVWIKNSTGQIRVFIGLAPNAWPLFRRFLIIVRARDSSEASFGRTRRSPDADDDWLPPTPTDGGLRPGRVRRTSQTQ